MGAPSTKDDAARIPGAAAVFVVALAAGLLGGVLFGIRDSARVVLESPDSARMLRYGEMLRFGLEATARSAAIGCVLMAVVAGGLVLLVLAGRRFPALRPLTCSAGILAFVALSVVMLLHRELLGSAHWPAHLFAVVEVGLVAIFWAIGIGVGVSFLRQKAVGAGGLVALVVAALAALFLLANWGLWLYLAVRPQLGGLGRAAMGATVPLTVLLLGVGLYALTAPAAARKRAIRRRGLGALLVGAAAALFAGFQLAVARRVPCPGEPAPTPAMAKAPSRPNILWIVMDTARADALHCYGCSRPTTPCLDAIAAEGALYERAITAAPWTLPSHAAMFTGMLPSRNRTTAEHQFLDDGFVTVAEELAGLGYRTLAYSNNVYATGQRHNLHQGFGRHQTHTLGKSWRASLLAHHFDPCLHLSDYGARETNETVARWIDAHVADGDPFFVFINYMEAHKDYGVTPAFRRWLPADVSPAEALAVSQNSWPYNAGIEPMSPRQLQILRALYDSDVTYLDGRVGELVEHIRELGILDNTLLIITSDHGELIGEHHLIGHLFSLYNEALHVPLIVRYPARLSPGTRVSPVVELLDIYPTILDAAGVDPHARPQLQGHSLLRPAEAPKPRYAVSEYGYPVHLVHDGIEVRRSFDTARFLRRLKSIQSSQLKYIWASDGRHELFDLHEDPDEQHNLIHEHPDKAAALHARLEARLGTKLRPDARASAAPNRPRTKRTHHAESP